MTAYKLEFLILNGLFNLWLFSTMVYCRNINLINGWYSTQIYEVWKAEKED